MALYLECHLCFKSVNEEVCMSTQITTNNLLSNQAIELKTPQNIEQDNVEAKVSDYNSSGRKVIFSAENEKISLYNFDKNNIKASEGSTKNTKEDALELEEAVKVVADFMHLSIQNVNFQKDETSNKTIIKVFDTESNDLIKQFPSEEIIDIAHKILALRQDVGLKTGILLDEQV